MASKNKEIQLTVNIGQNDLERKAKQAAKFLDKGLGVNVKLRLRRGRESERTGDAMLVVNKFIAHAGIDEKKVNALRWNDTTLVTFLHP